MRVIVQKWEESERGWGQRPDGFSIHKSEADLNDYIKEYWESMPKETPDEYERPSGTPYPHVLTPEEEEAFKELETQSRSKFGVRIYDNNYPGSGGIDGWIPRDRKPQPMSSIVKAGRREAYVPQKGYFTIFMAEDGPRIGFYSKEELQKKLQEQGFADDIEIVTSIEDIDLERGNNRLLIIKGETIKPGQVEVVTKYEIP